MAKDPKETKDAKAAKPAAPAAPAPEGQAAQPGIQVVSQYIKDLSFENPNAPESLVSGWPAPDTNVQVFLGQKNIRENVYECVLHFKIEAKKKGEDKTCFIIDLHYAALVALHNIPSQNVAPVLMVEVPKLLFPFAREIVAKTTASGGYPPLYLTPISFETLYMNEVKRLQAEQGEKGQQLTARESRLRFRAGRK